MLQTTTNPTTQRDRAPQPLHPAVCDSCDAGTSEVVIGNDPDGFVLCRECLSRLDTILSRGRQLAT
jgi:hypothetical protein